MGISDLLLPEYDHEIALTRRLFERLGDEKLAWKPHGRSRSLGGLATHVANLPTWTEAILDRSGFDTADVPRQPDALPSRAAILKLLDESSSAARARLPRTDTEYLALWTLTTGGRERFTMPRVMAFRTFVLNHLIHHRGQLSLYLRLNDVPVPAIYGPSADEG